MIYYIYIYLCINNEILPFVPTWVDLDVMLMEINQRKRNTTWFHLQVQSKIKTKNNFKKSRNRIIDIENKMVITRVD